MTLDHRYFIILSKGGVDVYVNKELKVIRELLSLTQKELAIKLGVSLDTISRWENEKTDIEDKNIEAIYNFAFEKGININRIYEQIFYEDCEKWTDRKFLKVDCDCYNVY